MAKGHLLIAWQENMDQSHDKRTCMNHMTRGHALIT